MMAQLIDRLSGKGASITYSFDNLAIAIPKAEGPDGKNWISAEWTINGKIVITAEAYDAMSNNKNNNSSNSKMQTVSQEDKLRSTLTQ